MQLVARSPSEVRVPGVLFAIGEAMFAEDGEVPRATLEARLRASLAVVSAATWPVRFGLHVALVLLQVAPLLCFAHARTLERLPLAERVRFLERLERSSFLPLCLAFVGWRTIATLVFYEDPSELRALGYTSDERHRHKRALPVLPSAPAPLESGVRLRDDGLADTGEHEIRRDEVA